MSINFSIILLKLIVEAKYERFFIFIGILALIGYADQFLNTQTNTKTTATKSNTPKSSTSIKTYDYEEKNNEIKKSVSCK